MIAHQIKCWRKNLDSLDASDDVTPDVLKAWVKDLAFLCQQLATKVEQLDEQIEQIELRNPRIPL